MNITSGFNPQHSATQKNFGAAKTSKQVGFGMKEKVFLKIVKGEVAKEAGIKLKTTREGLRWGAYNLENYTKKLLGPGGIELFEGETQLSEMGKKHDVVTRTLSDKIKGDVPLLDRNGNPVFEGKTLNDFMPPAHPVRTLIKSIRTCIRVLKDL